jgi:hypothetical protein
MQPGKLQRAKKTGPSVALVGDLLDLVLRILVDAAKEGDVFRIMQETAENAGNRFVEQVYKNIEKAEKRLHKLLRPLISSLDDFAKTLPDTDEAAEFVDFAIKLITKIAEKAANLSIDQLRQPIKELLEIFQEDLGLSGDFIEQQVWALVDDLIAGLEMASADSGNGDRKNCRQMALVLRRFKRTLYGRFTFPGYNADRLAEGILSFLRQYGVEELAKKTACYGEKVGDIASVASSLAKLVPYSSFGPNTLGAAEVSPWKRKTYLWYATWLYGDKEWNLKEYEIYMSIISKILMSPYPKDAVYIYYDEKKLVRRGFDGGFKTLGSMENGKWENAEPIKHYSFEQMSAGTIEGFARHFSYSFELFEALLHGLSIEYGDWLSNSLIIISNIVNTLVKLRKDTLVTFITYLGRLLFYIIGSLPGIHTKASFWPAFMHWLSILGANSLEAFIYYSLAQIIPDAFLSFVTLLNHKDNHEVPGKGKKPSENYKEVGGFNSFIGFLFSLFPYPFIIPDIKKKYYGGKALRKRTGETLGWWLGIELCKTLLNVSIGTFGGQLIARNFNEKLWKKEIGRVLLREWPSILKSWATFWPTYYMGEEGQTDGGKYNPTSDKKFDGYPSHSTSPYKLPFKKGKQVRCHQGNQGLWSHNNFEDPSLVYAYDFDLDQGEEVLASRGGHVVDYFDWVPDDEEKKTDAPSSEIEEGQTSKSKWNFIVIRHDNDPDDPKIDPAAHDKDEGGAKVTTYCVYGRGSKGSIKKALGGEKIIGRLVKQGDVIMKAGNTGDGWFNHLHIDVRPGPDAPASTTDKTPVLLSQLKKRTIPFVFKDAKHKAPLEFNIKLERPKDDGVPRSLNWYESDNG